MASGVSDSKGSNVELKFLI